jgi:hypothetical protein
VPGGNGGSRTGLPTARGNDRSRRSAVLPSRARRAARLGRRNDLPDNRPRPGTFSGTISLTDRVRIC